MAHWEPHPPQLVLVPREVSQPSPKVPLQSPQPAEQVGTQVPVAQDCDPWLMAAAHGEPHAPQSVAVVSGT